MELPVTELYLLLCDSASDEKIDPLSALRHVQALHEAFYSELRQYGLQDEYVGQQLQALCRFAAQLCYQQLLHSRPGDANQAMHIVDQCLEILADVRGTCAAVLNEEHHGFGRTTQPQLQKIVDAVQLACLHIEATRALNVGDVTSAFDTLSNLDEMLRQKAREPAHASDDLTHTFLCITWSLMAEACVCMRRPAHAVLYAQAAIRAGHQGIRGTTNSPRTMQTMAMLLLEPHQAAVLSYYALAHSLSCSGPDNTHLAVEWFQRTVTLCKYHIRVSGEVGKYLEHRCEIGTEERFEFSDCEEDHDLEMVQPALRPSSQNTPLVSLDHLSLSHTNLSHVQQQMPPPHSYVSTPPRTLSESGDEPEVGGGGLRVETDPIETATTLLEARQQKEQSAVIIQRMIRRRQARQQVSKYSRHLAYLRRDARRHEAALSIQQAYRAHRRKHIPQMACEVDTTYRPQPCADPMAQYNHHDATATISMIEQEELAAMTIASEIIQRNVRAHLQRRRKHQPTSSAATSDVQPNPPDNV